MKKKVFCFALMAIVAVLWESVCAWGSVPVDEEHFPDETFREYVSSDIDINPHDGTLSDAEIEAVTEIDVSRPMSSKYSYIETLKGIEYFTALKTLNCYDDSITRLDLSKNIALSSLTFSFNELTTLDLSKNINLPAGSNGIVTQATAPKKEVAYSLTGYTTHDGFAWSFNLADIDPSFDITCVHSLDIADSHNRNSIKHSADMTSGTVFVNRDDTVVVRYYYDTKWPSSTVYMYVKAPIAASPQTVNIVLNSGSNVNTFPDNTFFDYVKRFDTDNDGILSDTERKAVTAIDVSGMGITSLRGLEFFTNLTSLDCRNNKLASISLSSRPSLTYANCSEQVVSLDNSMFTSTDDSTYPYSLSLASIDINMAYRTNAINSLDVTDSSGTVIANSIDTSASGAILFESIPARIAYDYDTGAKNSSGEIIYMHVTIGNPNAVYIPELTLSPSSQTVRAAEGITAIAINTNASSWSFTVSRDYSLGLTSSDTAITGTVPSATPAGTYTIIVTAVDGQTSTATITVTAGTSGQTEQGSTEQDNTSTTTPDSTNIYRFTMSESLRNAIASAFPGMEIFQLNDSEILSGTWSLTQEDTQEISGMNEYAVLNLPEVRPENTGAYVMMLTLSGAEPGAKIRLHGISQVNASSLVDMQYKFFDAEGKEIDTVPDDRIVYASVVMTAGNEYRGTVTGSYGLPRGSVMPIDESKREGLLDTIAEVMSLDKSQLRFLRDDEIYPAQEPTQEMIDFAKSKDYDFIGKLATIQVDEPGYYVFKVVCSDDLFKQIEGLNADDVSVFGFDVSLEGSSVKSSFFMLNGILNTMELLKITGHKLDKFGLREFLMVGLFNSSQPFTLFLAKAIISILTGGLGGCNAGLGIIGIASVMAFIIRRRKL